MRIELKNVYLILSIFNIVENTAENHEKRIKDLEARADAGGTTYDYSQTIVNGEKTQGISRNKELENELKHLEARVDDTQKALDTLLKKRNDIGSTAQTIETHEDDDDDTRETLENQLQAIKTRLSRVEDSNSKIFFLKLS